MLYQRRSPSGSVAEMKATAWPTGSDSMTSARRLLSSLNCGAPLESAGAPSTDADTRAVAWRAGSPPSEART